MQKSQTQSQIHPLIIVEMNENKCRTMELELVKSCDGFLVYFSVLNRMGRNLSPGTSTLASSRRKNEAAQAPKDD